MVALFDEGIRINLWVLQFNDNFLGLIELIVDRKGGGIT